MMLVMLQACGGKMSTDTQIMKFKEEPEPETTCREWFAPYIIDP